MYDRIQGVLDEPVGEGTHFRVPWFQTPNVMDIRTRPRSISSVTGTKGELVGQRLQFFFRCGTAGHEWKCGASCRNSIMQAQQQYAAATAQRPASRHRFASPSAPLPACLPARLPPPHPARPLSADLQMVNITLRVLSKPDVEQLPRIFRVRLGGKLPIDWLGCLPQLALPCQLKGSGGTHAPSQAPLSCPGIAPNMHSPTCVPAFTPSVSQNLGTDWDERVLPSIGNEVLKAVVAQYQAEQLLTQVGAAAGWLRGGLSGQQGRRWQTG